MLNSATYADIDDDNSASLIHAHELPIQAKFKDLGRPFNGVQSGTRRSATVTPNLVRPDATFVRAPTGDRSMNASRLASKGLAYSTSVSNLLKATVLLGMLSFSISMIAVVVRSHAMGSLGAYLLFASALAGWMWLERADYERKRAAKAS